MGGLGSGAKKIHGKVTYIRLPDDLRIEAERLAERDECGLHNVLRRAIRKGLPLVEPLVGVPLSANREFVAVAPDRVPSPAVNS
jgi:hypothetical protein